MMNYALRFAVGADAATGLALLLVPSLVGRLLLGEELLGIAIPLARVFGLALIALGIACWHAVQTSHTVASPGRQSYGPCPPRKLLRGCQSRNRENRPSGKWNNCEYRTP
jgi:hypothetical protein